LLENCKTSIKKIPVSALSGKTICIDSYNYMYKFAGDNILLSEMAKLLLLFQIHHITPLFVFDGKAPIEKRELLQKRRQDRWEAKQQCEQLQQKWDEITDEKSRMALEEEMIQWKRRALYLSTVDINAVKDLIRSFGYTIIDAVGEADEECASLVKRGKAWACMSEDMDLFVYGCDRVIRGIDLNTSSVTLYFVDDILRNLNMSQQELREICILSGTDYNIYEKPFHLLHSVKLYKKYKSNSYRNNLSFYEWLHKKMKYNINIPLLQNINKMFASV